MFSGNNGVIPYKSQLAPDSTKIPFESLKCLSISCKEDEEESFGSSSMGGYVSLESMTQPDKRYKDIGVQTERVRGLNACNQTISFNKINGHQLRTVGTMTEVKVMRNSADQTKKIDPSELGSIVDWKLKTAGKKVTCTQQQKSVGAKQKGEGGAKNAGGTSKEKPVAKSTSTTPAIVNPKNKTNLKSARNNPKQNAKPSVGQKTGGVGAATKATAVAQRKGCEIKSLNGMAGDSKAQTETTIKKCNRCDACGNNDDGGKNNTSNSSKSAVLGSKGQPLSNIRVEPNRGTPTNVNCKNATGSFTAGNNDSIRIEVNGMDKQQLAYVDSLRTDARDRRYGQTFEVNFINIHPKQGEGLDEANNENISHASSKVYQPTAVKDESKHSKIIYLTDRAELERKAELLVNAVPFRMPGSSK